MNPIQWTPSLYADVSEPPPSPSSPAYFLSQHHDEFTDEAGSSIQSAAAAQSTSTQDYDTIPNDYITPLDSPTLQGSNIILIDSNASPTSSDYENLPQGVSTTADHDYQNQSEV